MKKALPIDVVAAKDLDRTIHQIITPALKAHGFEKIGNRKWVRSSKAPIREVFLLMAMKGTSLVPCCGFSLDYVPHFTAGRVRWHRSAKLAMFDKSALSFPKNGYGKYTISRFYGLPESRRAAREMITAVLAPMLAAFDQVMTIPDLLPAFEEFRSHVPLGLKFENYPQVAMAYSFTLARLKRKKEAEKSLKSWINLYKPDAIETKKLWKALDEALMSKTTTP